MIRSEGKDPALLASRLSTAVTDGRSRTCGGELHPQGRTGHRCLGACDHPLNMDDGAFSLTGGRSYFWQQQLQLQYRLMQPQQPQYAGSFTSTYVKLIATAHTESIISKTPASLKCIMPPFPSGTRPPRR